MKKIPIIDTHCDIVIPYQDLQEKFASASRGAQTSLHLLRSANVKIIFAGFSYDDLLKDSYIQLKNIHRMIAQFPQDFELITDFSQAKSILNSNKIGVIIHLEGAAILDNKISNLIKLYKKGLRSLGFTHNTKNCLGTGALVDDQKGLTKFGKKVIKTCNELKIILDLAHLNQAGFDDVVKYSTKIPIISHGNCYSLTKNPRNYTDQQLKKMSQLGSVVGVFFSGKFLKRDNNPRESTLDDAIAHIKHMVKVMGINYVALGCDFGGITTGLPKGLENHSKIKTLLKKLKEEGFSQEDLEKIAYKNALRIIEEYS